MSVDGQMEANDSVMVIRVRRVGTSLGLHTGAGQSVAISLVSMAQVTMPSALVM